MQNGNFLFAKKFEFYAKTRRNGAQRHSKSTSNTWGNSDIYKQGKKAFGHSAARLLKVKFNRLKCCRILELLNFRILEP